MPRPSAANPEHRYADVLLLWEAAAQTGRAAYQCPTRNAALVLKNRVNACRAAFRKEQGREEYDAFRVTVTPEHKLVIEPWQTIDRTKIEIDGNIDELVLPSEILKSLRAAEADAELTPKKPRAFDHTKPLGLTDD